MNDTEPSSTAEQSASHDAGVTRRRFLAGVGAGTVAGLGTTTRLTSARSGRTVTIPIVKHRGEVLQAKEVPERWWAREQAVDRVQAQLRSRFADDPGVVGVGLGASDQHVAGRRTTAPIVFTDPDRPTQSDVPSSVGDVAVRSKEVYDPEPETCYTGDYDQVPGGAQVEHGGAIASATCPVSLSDGTHALMTCAHLFPRCSGGIWGESLYQSGQYVGYVQDYSVGQDWAAAPLSSSADVSGLDNQIAGTYSEVTGYVTRSGLRDHISSGTTVYKNGRTSCETSGVVEEIEVPVRVCGGDQNETVNYYFVRTSTPTDNGDSGSPHYHEFFFNNDRKAAIVAPHYGGESVGCAAYRIRNTNGVGFGAY